MSSSIWTRCGGISNRKRLAARAFRAVEAQHRISTRKLTDSDAEQVLLEDLLESSKPALAGDLEGLEGLHYLLFTPFRYPPLRHGSRFGVKTEGGIWYGSQTLPTCFAEVAYYRLVFLEGTTAKLAPLPRRAHGVSSSHPNGARGGSYVGAVSCSSWTDRFAQSL